MYYFFASLFVTILSKFVIDYYIESLDYIRNRQENIGSNNFRFGCENMAREFNAEIEEIKLEIEELKDKNLKKIQAEAKEIKEKLEEKISGIRVAFQINLKKSIKNVIKN